MPLQVVIGATVYDEGADGATPELVAEALKEFRPVSTSRPAPAALLEVYEKAAAEGADAILSIHLSGGDERHVRVGPARGARRLGPGDRRRLAPGRGRDRLRRAGGGGRRSTPAARSRRPRRPRAREPTGATSLFYVDTLEYLRRGGRIGAAAALLGGALAVKPLLQDRRRPGRQPRAGAHLGARAEPTRGPGRRGGRRPGRRRLRLPPGQPRPGRRARRAAGTRLATNLDGRDVWCGELGAVLGAHVGPGMVAVCVAPRLG